MAKNDNSFPHQIAAEVKDFHLKLVELKKGLQPIINNLYQIRDDIEKAKDPIKAATLELTVCQAINSLFYSKFCGDFRLATCSQITILLVDLAHCPNCHTRY